MGKRNKPNNYKNTATKLKEARANSVSANRQAYANNNAEQSKLMQQHATMYGIDIKTLQTPRKLFKLGSLKFGVDFQREKNRVQIDHIKNNFDPVFARGITIWVNKSNCEVPAGNYILDGEHRVAAMLDHADYGPDAMIMCDYFDGMSYQEAAYYFAHQHDYKRRLSAYDKLKAEKESGNANAIAVVNILTKHGVNPDTDGPNGVKAIATLNSAFKELGAVDFERLVTIISSSFDSDPDRFSMDNIKAVKVIIKAYGDKIEDKRVIQVMNEPGYYKRVSIKSRNLSSNSNPVYKLIAAEIVAKYNYKKVKNKLDVNLLNSTK